MSQWLEIVIRSVSIIIGLFLVTKLLGKKQLSRLSSFEYIAGITIGDIAGTLSMDNNLEVKHGVTSILIWLLFPLLASKIGLKSKVFRDFMEGNATVFIRDGKILEDNLRKEKYSIDEFLEQLRKKKVFQVSDVQFATLESNGELNVLLKREKQPVVYGDLFTDAPYTQEPQTVIMDGRVLDEPLTRAGLNRRWLYSELEKRDVLLVNVFLAQVDTYGNVTLDLFNDQIHIRNNKEREIVLTALKKCHTDMEYLAIVTKYKEFESLYEHFAKEISNVEREISKYLSSSS